MIRNKKPLQFRAESIRTLNDATLAEVNGGGINKCTGQWSGCETVTTNTCWTQCESCYCTHDASCRCL
jgi:hypothetical protein